MYYFQLDFRPTEEQLAEIGSVPVLDGANLGNPGSYFLAYDEEQYGHPDWITSQGINIPGEPHLCVHGEPI